MVSRDIKQLHETYIQKYHTAGNFTVKLYKNLIFRKENENLRAP